nr:MAG TPA: hypothetical protein [Caudoviricetes sp.]
MKITVDARAAMKSAADYVLNDLECLPVDIELTDDPNDLLKTASDITSEYQDEFFRCLEMEFNFRLFHSISKQLADNGIHIVRKEDS